MGRAAEGYVAGESSGEPRPEPGILHLYSECRKGSAISYKIPVSALSSSTRDALSWCSWCERQDAAESGISPPERPPPSLITYEFIGGPFDGRQMMLSPLAEGFGYLILRPPADGKIVRDEHGRDNMRESSYKVTYEPKTGRPLMIWQGEK
jgi:hypothetical protein